MFGLFSKKKTKEVNIHEEISDFVRDMKAREETYKDYLRKVSKEKISVSENFRKAMSSIDTTDLVRRYEKDLGIYENPKKQAEYVARIHELKGNKNLEKLITDLMVEQTREVALEAPTWEHVLVSRGTLNGIKLVWDTIKILSVEFEQKQNENNPDED